MKRFFLFLGKKLKNFWEKIKPGKKAWLGAAWGLGIGSVLFWTVVNLLTWEPGMLIWPVAAIILVTPLLLFLASGLIHLLLEWITRWNKFFRFVLIGGAALLIFAFVLTTAFELAALLGMFLLVLSFSTLGAAGAILAKRGWHILTKAQRTVFIIGFGFGGLLLAGSLVWLVIPGGKVIPAQNAALNSSPINHSEQLPDPTQSGDYGVTTFTYGSGADLRRVEFGEDVNYVSRSVDATPFVQGWKGIAGWVLKQYWGFDLESLPLNGRVWMPEGEGPFPLVLVVHGNHRQEDFSDPGYDYLGELLASRGMILVSIDENFLNGTWTSLFGGDEIKNENDARAWMLLEHFRLWKEWNENQSHPLYGKVNWNQLALIGHSRGGEAVAEAALFNHLSAYPDDALIDFNYQYPIQAVVAIAPVDSQYNPGDWKTPLSDVNYLVLQGSMDGDVSSFDGMGQYQRITFSPDSDYFKSAVYIHGANHGQFNSVWGISDVGPGLGAALLNTQAILDQEDQEQAAQGFISAFLEASLLGKDEYRAVFRDWRTGQNWLPDTVFLTRYQDANLIPVATYQEDLDVKTATLPEAYVDTARLTEWREGLYKGKWNQDMSTSLVLLTWDQRGKTSADPFYRINLPVGTFPLNAQGYLVFSMADTGKDPNMENSETYPEITNESGINFTLELAAGEETAAVSMDQNLLLQPQLKVELAKIGFLNKGEEGEAVLQTFYLPLSLFAAENPEFDFSQLSGIKFCFDQSKYGSILLDDIGFWQAEGTRDTD